jgi:hypothetical protein
MATAYEPPSDDELREHLVRQIDTMVRAGFLSRTEIEQSYDDTIAEGKDTAALTAYAREALNAAWARQRSDEKSWSGMTDCDRLDAAFAELEGAGIIARQDYWCCQTCGCSAAADEMRELSEAGQPIRGYTFYHAQDTERGVDGAGVFLSFGAASPDDADWLSVARDVVAVLERYGLKPRWNRTLEQRINVPLEWRRRRFTVR